MGERMNELFRYLEQEQRQKEDSKCKEDIAYFASTLKTFDPRTSKKDLKFELYPFQIDYANKLIEKIKTGEDGFVEKSRDMGVSWVTLLVIYWFWKFNKDFQCLLGSRKEEYVDDWTMKSLFPKIEYFIKCDPTPPNYERKYMQLINKDNGSVIQGESANANFSRAGRYNVIFFDEFPFWPFQQSSWESAGDATPCRLAVGTPSPQPTYAKSLRNSGIVEVITLHWTLHPKKDQVWYEKEKGRRTAEETARELDINWEGSLEGIVFPEHVNCVFGKYPYIPEWPLYVSWDFGLDGTAIGWWQKNPQTGKWRRIESYFKTNKPIHYFLPFFGHPIEAGMLYTQSDLDLISKVKDYQKASHFGDPDVGKRSYQTKEMTSTREVLQQHSIYVQTNAQSNNFEDRLPVTKMFLQSGVEVDDTPGNKLWYEAIKSYRFPERQEGSQATTAIIKPIHDWSSHHATETQYLAVNVKSIPGKKRKKIIGYTGGDPVTGYGRQPIYANDWS
jgi:hypothetical protein